MILKKRIITICFLFWAGLGLCSCNSPSSNMNTNFKDGLEEVITESPERIESPGNTKSPESEEKSEDRLIYKSSMELKYAEKFTVDYYEKGYSLLSITDGRRFLIVPEGEDIPEGVEEDVVILKQPIKNLYLVATAVMSMFHELDALDTISLSGQKEDGWYIEEAKDAMRRGDMVYAGKYNQPDYELILSKGCSLAIENMMISHSPEVIEKLEDFEIPVLVEYSSYEPHPLGRVEWIKFFGALLGKEELAESVFNKQEEILERVKADEKTNKTVAFFFITSSGLVQVRRTSDYVPKMIELAGGKYIFDDFGEESNRSTMNMQMEEFYNTAKNADFLIYNSAIDGGITSLDELFDKSELLKDFKAVREGNVWCTTNDMYQQSMSIGYLIEDIHNMLLEEQEKQAEMTYLFRLN